MIRRSVFALSFVFCAYGAADCNVPKPKPKTTAKRIVPSAEKYSLGVSTASSSYAASSPITMQSVTVSYPPALAQKRTLRTVIRTVTVTEPSKKNHIGALVGSFKTGLNKRTDGCCNTTYTQGYELDIGAYYLREFGDIDLGGFYTSKKNFGWMFGVSF